MKFLAWDSTLKHKNIVPFIWGACYNDPVTEGKAVAEKLKAQDIKVLFLWHPCDGLSTGLTEAGVLADIPTSEKLTKWFEAFYRTIKDSGVTPDYLVCDYEDWIGDWNWGSPMSQLLIANQNLKTAFLRAAYYPYVYIFGVKTKFVGWGSMNLTHSTFMDRNGWEYPIGDYSYTGDSSPAIYLDQGGNFFNLYQDQGRGPYLKKDVLWNCITQNLNNLRAMQGSWTAPWVDYPTFSNDNNTWRSIPQTTAWIWNEQLKHLNAMGNPCCLWWNPNIQGSTNSEYALKCINALPEITKKPDSLPQISYDSDTLVTGGVTTTYNDFLLMLQKDNCKVYDRTNHVADTQPSPQPVPVTPTKMGYKIYGTVTTSDGKPYVGANVGYQTKKIVWTSADTNGNYHFDNVDPSYCSIVVLKTNNKLVKADQYYQLDVKDKDIKQDIVIK